MKPTLTFTAATDTGGAGTDHYNVYRDGALLGTALTTSYTETSASYPDGAYSYAVSAVDKAGNEGPQTTPKVVVYDTTAPVAPATPTTSAPVTKVKPAISWTATTDPGGSGVASYTVYRDGVQIAAAALGHELPGHGARRPTARTRTRSAPTTRPATPPAITATVSVTYDTVAPPVPVSLNGTTPTGSSPALTWTSGGPDTLSGFDHYEILRSGATIGTQHQPGVHAQRRVVRQQRLHRQGHRPRGQRLGRVRVEDDRLRQHAAGPADQPRRHQPDEPAGADVDGADRRVRASTTTRSTATASRSARRR